MLAVRFDKSAGFFYGVILFLFYILLLLFIFYLLLRVRLLYNARTCFVCVACDFVVRVFPRLIDGLITVPADVLFHCRSLVVVFSNTWFYVYSHQTKPFLPAPSFFFCCCCLFVYLKYKFLWLCLSFMFWLTSVFGVKLATAVTDILR